MGYNIPEQPKHRNRGTQSIEQPKLASFSAELYELLFTPFWDQKCWNAFMAEVEQLAYSVNGYSDLLQKQQLRMKAVHACPAPVWKLSDGLSVKSLKRVGPVILCMEN